MRPAHRATLTSANGSTNTFNGLTANAVDTILADVVSVINTTGDALSFTAGNSITLDGGINTGGGAASFAATSFTIDDSDDLIDTDDTTDGNVTITADNIDLDAGNGSTGGINAGTANVSIERKTTGTIMLGDNTGLGGTHLTQAEIAAIDAGTLNVGGANTYRIDASNVNTTTGTINGLVTLITGNGFTGNYDDVRFGGANVFNGLNIQTNDSVIFVNGATVDSFGNVTMTSDTNDATVGYLYMGVNSNLETHGSNATVNTLQVVLDSGAYIDAQGGNIDINNPGLFYTVNAGSLRTSGTGTISLNQNDDTTTFFGVLGDLGVTLSGSVANAVSAFANSGTGQNTLDVYNGTGDGV
ncbi:MAG: hypothetical protein IPO54_03960 [Micavibrio sp.]|nr:hypothetical protein [Micavibrio sp.]